MLKHNAYFCTIITSETLLMDRTYIVTPTVTGEPEITKEKQKEKKVIYRENVINLRLYYILML